MDGYPEILAADASPIGKQAKLKKEIKAGRAIP
jgi:hypothetical protein